MYDTPTPDMLIDAVATLLMERVLPYLQGDVAYQTRVAGNALRLAARSVRNELAAKAIAADHLKRLTGAQGTYQALTDALCEKIRMGDIAPDDESLLAYLWADVLERLKTDQPTYSAYRRHEATPADTALE